MNKTRYWDLSDPVMVQALRMTVQGRAVLEIGGADGELAEMMINDLCADHVLVVEKELMFRTIRDRYPYARVNFFWDTVQEFATTLQCTAIDWDVMVVSWPSNHPEFDAVVVKIMRQVAQVVIIGKNDGVTASGTNVLWDYLVTRERTQHVAGLHNDLVVYGPNPRPPAQVLVPIEEFGVNYITVISCLTTSPLLQPKTN